MLQLTEIPFSSQMELTQVTATRIWIFRGKAYWSYQVTVPNTPLSTVKTLAEDFISTPTEDLHLKCWAKLMGEEIEKHPIISSKFVEAKKT